MPALFQKIKTYNCSDNMQYYYDTEFPCLYKDEKIAVKCQVMCSLLQFFLLYFSVILRPFNLPIFYSFSLFLFLLFFLYFMHYSYFSISFLHPSLFFLSSFSFVHFVNFPCSPLLINLLI